MSTKYRVLLQLSEVQDALQRVTAESAACKEELSAAKSKEEELFSQLESTRQNFESVQEIKISLEQAHILALDKVRAVLRSCRLRNS